MENYSLSFRKFLVLLLLVASAFMNSFGQAPADVFTTCEKVTLSGAHGVLPNFTHYPGYDYLGIAAPHTYTPTIEHLREGPNKVKYTYKKGGKDYEDVVMIYRYIPTLYEKRENCSKATITMSEIPLDVLNKFQVTWNIVPHYPGMTWKTDYDGTHNYCVIRGIPPESTVTVDYIVKDNSGTSISCWGDSHVMTAVTNHTPTAVGINNGDGSDVCENFTHLSGSDHGSSYEGYWFYSGPGATFSDRHHPETDISNMQIGKHTFGWKVTHKASGCHDVAWVRIYNRKVDLSSLANIESCKPSEKLAEYPDELVNPADDGPDGTPEVTWNLGGSTGGGTATISDKHDIDAYIQGMVEGGEYHVNLKVEHGFCTENKTITVKRLASGLQARVINSSNHKCATLTNDDSDLTTKFTLEGIAPAGVNAKWEYVGTASGVTAPTGATGEVTVPPGVHKFRWYSVGNTSEKCDGQVYVTVYNDEPSIVDVHEQASSSNNDCTSDRIVVGTAPGEGEHGMWSGSSPRLIFSNGGSNNVTEVSNLSQDVNQVTWTLYKGGCARWKTIDIQYSKVLGNVTASPFAGYLCEQSAEAQIMGTDPASISPTAVGTWTALKGNAGFADEHAFSTLAKNLDKGENILEWKIKDGACSASDTVGIWNYAVEATAVEQNAGQNNCTKDDRYVQGNPPITSEDETGRWSSTDASISFEPDPTSPTAKVVGLRPGKNTVTWTITSKDGKCQKSADVVLNFINLENVNLTTTKFPDPVCYELEDEAHIIASPSPAAISSTAKGRWRVIFGDASIDDKTSNDTWIRRLGRGDITIRWTVTDDGGLVGTGGVAIAGCEQYVDLVISNYKVDAFAGDDTFSCDSTTNLIGNDPSTLDLYNTVNGDVHATGFWTKDPTINTSIIDKTDHFDTGVTDMPADINNYVWHVTNGYCSATDTVMILNDAVGPVDAGPDDIFCGIDFDKNPSYEELYGNLNGSIPGKDEHGSWSITAGDARFIGTTTDPHVNISHLKHYVEKEGSNFWNQHPTINTFRWTVSNEHCTRYDDVNIVNAAPREARAGKIQHVCFDEVYLNALDRGWGAYEHWWTSLKQDGSVNSEVTFDNKNLPSAYARGLAFGANKFEWRKRNVFDYATNPNTYLYKTLEGFTKSITCEVWDTVTIFRMFDETTQRPNAGPDEAVCGNTWVMSATDPIQAFSNNPSMVGTYTGRWEYPLDHGYANIVDPTSYQSPVTNLSVFTNIFRWTVTFVSSVDDKTCTASDLVQITNELPSAARINTTTKSVCTDRIGLSADRPTRGFGMWSASPTSIVIENKTCQDFNCTATATELVRGGLNTIVWNVNHPYIDPQDPDGPKKDCILTDTIRVYQRSLDVVLPRDTIYVCENKVLAEANELVDDVIGRWDPVAGNGKIETKSSNTTWITNLNVGVSQFSWTIMHENGDCPTDTILTVINNNPYDPKITGPAERDYCDEDPILTLQAINPPLNQGHGYWEVDKLEGLGTSRLSNTNNATVTVDFIPRGKNVYKWFVEKGEVGKGENSYCREETSVEIWNNSVDANAGLDQNNVCGFSTQTPHHFMVKLNAADLDPTTQTGLWQVQSSPGGSPGFSNESNDETEFWGDLAGKHRLMWTVTGDGHFDPAKKCKERDWIDIDVFIPDSADAGNDQMDICVGSDEIATLQAGSQIPSTSPSIGTWSVKSQIPGSSASIMNPNSWISKVEHLGMDKTVFKWSVGRPGCLSVDTVVLINNNVEAYEPKGEGFTCDGTFLLEGTDPNLYYNGFNKPKGTWFISPGPTSNHIVAASLNSYKVTAKNLSVKHVNKITWKIEKGSCDAISTINVVNGYFEIDAGDPQVVCFDSVQLHADPPKVGSTGTWRKLNGASGTIVNPNKHNTIVKGLSPNEYIKFEWKVNNGTCDAIDTTTVYYNKVVADAGGPYDRLCSDTISLHAVKPKNYPATASKPASDETGHWGYESFSDAPSPASGDADDWKAASVDVVNVAQGRTDFIWFIERTVDDKLCTHSDTVQVWNDKPNKPEVESNFSVCGNEALLHVTKNPGTGKWSTLMDIDFIDDETMTTVKVARLPIGKTKFKWTVKKGTCTDFAELTVANDSVFAVINQDEISSKCEDFVNLSAEPPLQGSGEWLNSSGYPVTFSSPLNHTTKVSGLRGGKTVFTWKVDKDPTFPKNEGRCPQTDKITVLYDKISAGDDTKVIVCSADDIQLNITNTLTNGTGYWECTANTADIREPKSQWNTFADGLDYGENEFVWHVKSFDGCEDESKHIIINAEVKASTMKDQEICGDNLPITASDPSPNKGTWEYIGVHSGVIIDQSSLSSTSVSGLSKPGGYRFRWTVVDYKYKYCPNATDVLEITNYKPVIGELTTDVKDICGLYPVKLNAPVVDKDAGERGEWTPAPGSFGNIITPTNNVTDVEEIPRGENTYVWTVYRGTGSCNTEKTITINNHYVKAVVNISEIAGCTDKASLQASPILQDGATGKWYSKDSHAKIVHTNSNITLVDGVERGYTHFSWTVTKKRPNGLKACADSAFVEVLNDFVPAELITTQLSDTVCAKEYDALPGVFPIGAKGIWSTTGGAIIEHKTLFNSKVTGLENNNNSFTWTVESNIKKCKDDISFEIYNKTITVSVMGDFETCDDTVNLIANENYAGRWTKIGGNEVVIHNATSYNGAYATGLKSGVYTFRWRVGNEGEACTEYADVVVTNNQPEIPNYMSATPTEVCDGKAILKNVGLKSGETGEWSKVTGKSGDFHIINSGETEVTGISNGINTFTWTVTKGVDVKCTAKNTVEVNNLSVNADAGNDRTTNCDNFIDLTAKEPVQGKGKWYFLGCNTDDLTQPSFEDSEVNNTKVSNLPHGTSSLQWFVTNTGPNGKVCSIADTVEIVNNAVTAKINDTDKLFYCKSTYQLNADDSDLKNGRGWGEWTKSNIENVSIHEPSNATTNIENITPNENGHTLTWKVYSNIDNCSDEKSFTIRNISVTLGEDKVVDVCSKVASLEAQSPHPHEGTWSPVLGLPTNSTATINDKSNNITAVEGIEDGKTYHFRWLVKSKYATTECGEDEQIFIVRNNKPLNVKASAPKKVCDNNTVVLQGSTPDYAVGETGEWSKSNYQVGTFVGGATSPEVVVEGMPQGKNVFTWTVTKRGCPASEDITVINNTFEADAGSPATTGCGNDVTLKANLSNGVTGVWSTTVPGVSISPENSAQAEATNLPVGEVSVFVWTATKGEPGYECTKEDAVEIINNSIEVSLANNEANTCNDKYTLLGTEYNAALYTGEWTCPNPSIIIKTPSIYNTEVQNLKPSTTYVLKWTITSKYGGCSDYDLFTLRNVKPVPGIVSDVITCENEVKIQATPPNNNSYGWWSHNHGSTINVSTIETTLAHEAIVTGIQDGEDYYFTWNVKNKLGNCSPALSNVAVHNMQPKSLPIASVDGSARICNGEVKLKGSTFKPSIDESGFWSFKTGSTGTIVDSTGIKTLVKDLPIGEPTTLLWTIKRGGIGCEKSAEITVTNNEVKEQKLDNITLCPLKSNLSAELPQGANGKWVKIGANAAQTKLEDSTIPSTGVDGLLPGESHHYQWVVSRGTGSLKCEVASDLFVINDRVPAVIQSKNPDIICGSQDYTTLTARSLSAGTGVWSKESNDHDAHILNSTNNTTMVKDLVGQHIFTWTVTSPANCKDIATVNVNYINIKADAGQERLTCGPIITDLEASDVSVEYEGHWEIVPGSSSSIKIMSSEHALTEVRGLVSGKNKLKWVVTHKDYSYCKDEDIVDIINNEVGNVTVSTTVNNKEVCEDDAIANIKGTEVDPLTERGEWTSVQSPSFGDKTKYKTTVTGLKPGENKLTWTIYKGENECHNEGHVIITNNTVKTEAQADNSYTCTGPIRISAQEPPKGTKGLWSLNYATFQNISESTQWKGIYANIKPGEIGEFTWTVTRDGSECKDIKKFTVVNGSVSAELTDPSKVKVVTCDGTTSLSAVKVYSPARGEWSLISGDKAKIKIDHSDNNNTFVHGIDNFAQFRWTVYSNTECGSRYVDVDVNNKGVLIDDQKYQSECSKDGWAILSTKALKAGESGSWEYAGSDAVVLGAVVSDNTLYVSGLPHNKQSRFKWNVWNKDCRTPVTQEYIFENIAPSEAHIITADNGITCDNKYNLEADNLLDGEIGLWQLVGVNSRLNIEHSDKPQTEVSGLASGKSTFKWIVMSEKDKSCFSDDDITIKNSAVSEAIAGDKVTVCNTDVANLGATAPRVGVGEWSITDHNSTFPYLTINSSTMANASISGFKSGMGIVRLTWTVKGDDNCSDYDYVEVVNNTPTKADAGGPYSPSCGDKFSLNAVSPSGVEKGYWQYTSGLVTMDDTNKNNATVSILPGEAELTWVVDKNGCKDEDKVIIKNKSYKIDVNASTLESCDGTVTLYGTNPKDVGSGGKGTWTVTVGESINFGTMSHNSVLNVSGLSTANDRKTTFKWTIDGDCPTSKEITIKNNEIHAELDAQPANQLCNSEQIILAKPVDNDAVAYWDITSTPPGSKPTVENSLSNSTKVKGLIENSTTGITWVVKLGNCPVRKKELFVEYYKPTARINTRTSDGCSEQITLMAAPIPSTASGVWTSTNPVVQSIIKASTNIAYVSQLPIGDTKFIWTVEDRGCENKDEVIINNSKPMNIATSYEQTLCSNRFVMNASPASASGVAGAVGYWKITDGADKVKSINTNLFNTVVVIEPGTVRLTWTITSPGVNGCSNTKEFIITNEMPENVSAGTGYSVCSDVAGLSASQPASDEKGRWEAPDMADNGLSLFATPQDSESPNVTVTLPKGDTKLRWIVKSTTGKQCETKSDIITMTNATFDVSAGANRHTCDPKEILNGTILKPGQTGVWSCDKPGVSFEDSYNNNTRVSGLKNGVTTFTWTITDHDCPSEGKVEIDYIEVIPNAGIAQYVCGPNEGELSAPELTPGTKGKWLMPSDPSIVIASTGKRVTGVKGLKSGENVFTWLVTTNDGKCPKKDNVSIFNEEVTQPSAQITNGEEEVCDGTVSLSGTVPKSTEVGKWVKVDAEGEFHEITSWKTTVTDLREDENTFRWILTKGVKKCTKESNIVKVINNHVEAEVLDQSTETCTGNVTLSATIDPATHGATGYWECANASLTNIAASSNWKNVAAEIDYNEIGIFWWNVEKGGCTIKSEPLKVANNSIIAQVITKELSNCSSTFNIKAKDPAPYKGFWSLDGPADPNIKILHSDNHNATVTGIKGTKTFKWNVISTTECISQPDDATVHNTTFEFTQHHDNGVECLLDGKLDLSAPPLKPNQQGVWNYIGTSPLVTISSANLVSAVAYHVPSKELNKFKWTVSNKADGTCPVDYRYYVYNNAPSQPEAGEDLETCDSEIDMKALPVEAGEIGTWIPVSAGGKLNILDKHEATSKVKGLKHGINKFKWRVQVPGAPSTCILEDSVNVKSFGIVAKAGEDQDNVCNKNVVELSATPPQYGSGHWTLVDAVSYKEVTITKPYSFSTDVLGTTGGNTYTFIWAVKEGSCPDVEDDVVITNNTPSKPNAGPDKTTCTGKVNLAAENPSVGYGYWRPISASASVDETANNMSEVTVDKGEHEFIWIVNKNGCERQDKVLVTNNSYKVAIQAKGKVNDFVTCDGTAILVGTDHTTISPTATGTWSVTHGDDIIPIGSIHSSILNLTGLTTNNDRVTTFVWFIHDKCDNSASISITNNKVDAGADQNDLFTCDNYMPISADEPSLQGDKVKGEWSIESGLAPGSSLSIENRDNASTVVKNLVPSTTTTLKWTVNLEGCSDEAIYNVEYFEPNVRILTQSTQHGCLDTIKLVAEALSATAVGEWSTTSTTNFDIVDKTNNSTYVTGLPIGNTTFIWTVTDRTCTDDAQVVINNSKPINQVGTTPQEACSDVFSMNAQVPINGATGEWIPGLGSVVVQNKSLGNTLMTVEPGKATMTWRISEPGGCSTDKLFTMINNNPRHVHGPDSLAVCEDQVILSADPLDNGSGVAPEDFETGEWSVPGKDAAYVDKLFGVEKTNSYVLVKNLDKGVTTFRWTVKRNNKCPKSHDVKVYNNTPVVNAGEDQTICGRETLLFAKNPVTGVGHWKCSNKLVVFEDSTKQRTKVSAIPGGESTTFTWIVDGQYCKGLTDDLVVNGVSVENIEAGSDEKGCFDEHEIQGTKTATAINPNWTTGYWEIVSGTGTFVDKTSYKTTVENLGKLTEIQWVLVYKDLIDGKVCKDSASVTYTNQLPTKASIKTDNPSYLCKDSLYLSATPAQGTETGVWEMIAGGDSTKILKHNYNQTWIKNLARGENKFVWRISNDICTTEDKIIVHNDQVFAFAGSDVAATCDTNVVIASPNPDDLYARGEWSCNRPDVTFDGTDDIVTSLHSTMATNLHFGKNIFTWKVTSKHNSACTDTDDMFVVSNKPRNVYASLDPTLYTCGTEIELTGSTPPSNGSGEWNGVLTEGSIAPKDMAHTFVKGLNTGLNQFSWTVEVEDCKTTAFVDVINNKIPVEAGVVNSVCNQDFIELEGATQPKAGMIGKWTVLGGDPSKTQFDNPTLYNTIVRGLQPGGNILKWTITDNTTVSHCENWDTVRITNNSPTQAEILNLSSYPSEICENKYNLQGNTPVQGVGVWRILEGRGKFVDSTERITEIYDIPDDPTQIVRVAWVIYKGKCESKSIWEFKNRRIPIFVGNTEVTVCNKDHKTLISAGELQYDREGYWSRGPNASGITILSPSNNITEVRDLEFGRKSLMWNVQNSDGTCKNSIRVYVEDNYYPTELNVGASVTTPLCQDNVALVGSQPSVADAYGVWDATSEDVSFDERSFFSTIARGLPSSECDIIWTIDYKGCKSPAKITLHNRGLKTYAGEDQITCLGEYPISATPLLPGQEGYWSVDNTVVRFDRDTKEYDNVAKNLIVGRNKFTWTVKDKYCSASADVTISNNVFQINAGNNDHVCSEDDTYQLHGSDPLGGEGFWRPTGIGNGEFDNPTLYNTTVSKLNPGDNEFIWKVTRNKCTVEAKVVITNDRYVATVGKDRPVCGGNAIVVGNFYEGIPDLKGEWEVLTPGAIVVGDNSNKVVNVENLRQGSNKFRWTLTSNHCPTHADIVLTNIASSSVVAYKFAETCDDQYELLATPLAEGEEGYWDGGGQLMEYVNGKTANATMVKGLNQGNNIFSWVTHRGDCYNKTQLLIESHNFNANAGVDQKVEVPYTKMTAILPSGATGSWTPAGGSGNCIPKTIPDASVINLGPGINKFTWTVEWNGCPKTDEVKITYNTLDPDPGKDTIICDSRIDLYAKDPHPAKGKWIKLSGSANFDSLDRDNPHMELTDIKQGASVRLRWEVEIGGYSEYKDVLISNGEFTIEAGDSIEGCVDYATFAAEPAGNNGVGEWSVVGTGGGNILIGSLENSVVKGLSPGTNTFKWHVIRKSGCEASDFVDVTYNVPPVANFEIDDNEGCSPLIATFNNTSVKGNKYYWAFGDDQREDTVKTQFSREYISYDSDSVYYTTLIAEDAKGCLDTITKSIRVFGIPNVKFEAYPEYQIYPDATVNIDNYSYDGYPNYYWMYGDGKTDVDSVRETGFSHDYETWGEYEISLAVNSGNCNDTISQTVVIAAPKPKNTQNQEFNQCAPLVAHFDANILYADSCFRVIRKLGDALDQGDTITGFTPSYLFDEAGTYFAHLFAMGPGLKAGEILPIRTDTIFVHPVPVANFMATPDTVMLPNQAVHCYNTSLDSYSYEWDFGDGSEISLKENPEHYYLKEGKYNIKLKVKSEYGCYSDTTMIEPIVVEAPGLCVFPNAFSPNLAGPSDGRYDPLARNNDVFHPVYRGVREYKLEIFNRWGAKIFESNDPGIGWDGYLEGKLVPQDVYVWKVSGKYKNGAGFSQTGDCTLLR